MGNDLEVIDTQNEIEKPSGLKTYLEGAKDRFITIIKESQYKGSYEKESYFAMQMIIKNDYLKGIAIKNPVSLQSALLNCATIGVTLNPAMKLSYLVPRSKEVIYELSYRGLIYLAIRDGGIKSATVDVVKEGDAFSFNGKWEVPNHHYDPFEVGRENKKTIGAYCVARLPDGSVITEPMSVADIEKAKKCSSMKEKTVWDQWFDEMAKKTVIKRASKMWPACPSLDRAIEMLNEENGEGFANTPKSKAEEINNALVQDNFEEAA